jgi:ketosteroid isomerase-like protein
MTPKEFLISYVENFNAGGLSSLINMYEIDACFVSQEGEVIKGIENIRQTLESFIGMKGKIESKVDRVIQTSDIALVNTEWSFNGAGPGVKQLPLMGKLRIYYVDNRMAIGVF